MSMPYLGKWFQLSGVFANEAGEEIVPCKVHDILFSDDNVENPIVFLMETKTGERFHLSKREFKEKANIGKL